MNSNPTRKPLMVGNWKMHGAHLEAIQRVQKLSYLLDPEDYDRVDVAVAPPFTSLRSVQTVIEMDGLPILIAAQNMHWEASGAYTGEISAPMLAKLSVSYVIAGHSERRRLFGEDDRTVNRKVRAALAAGLTPIAAVGRLSKSGRRGRRRRWCAARSGRRWPGFRPRTPPGRWWPTNRSGRSVPDGTPTPPTPRRWPPRSGSASGSGRAERPTGCSSCTAGRSIRATPPP